MLEDITKVLLLAQGVYIPLQLVDFKHLNEVPKNAMRVTQLVLIILDSIVTAHGLG